MDISTLVPLPVQLCKLDADGGRYGVGLAVCQDLGLLVISCSNKLHVFALPEDMVATTPRELELVRTLGGVAPLEFQFEYTSGYMAFTANRRLLLVTDGGCPGAVYVIDVVRGTHVGYVAAPGTILFPCGVATRRSLAAVSSYTSVRVFEGSGEECTWTAKREIAVHANGLRFTPDGLRLVVAEDCYGRVGIFCAKYGGFLCHVAFGPDANVYPMDVEKCGSEWIVCHFSGLVAVADNAAGAGAVVKRRDLGFNCRAFATVPGLGLLVVRHDTGVQFFATPDAVAMAFMSSRRVVWMAAVCRATIVRRLTKKQRFSE